MLHYDYSDLEVRVIAQNPGLVEAINRVYDHVVWASPKGSHYHIDIHRCGIVRDPAYSKEYVIIQVREVFKRELQPCQCALPERV